MIIGQCPVGSSRNVHSGPASSANAGEVPIIALTAASGIVQQIIVFGTSVRFSGRSRGWVAAPNGSGVACFRTYRSCSSVKPASAKSGTGMVKPSPTAARTASCSSGSWKSICAMPDGSGAVST